MANKVFHCEVCGKDSEEVLIDGYRFGDRLLEGVMFVVKGSKEKGIKARVREQHKEYFSGLSQKKWLQEAQISAAQSEDFSCINCGEDIFDEF